ncbi:cytochrome c-type biogenesis protein CcsB [Christiangramia gaetbulicola]|uniref:Cytochrome c-type biogenesis protein CcsB n=1 Tax=Christiangramia gaetbulicola TaxID=703340 RepID=A0A2T6AGH9_9FLAO|nr:cytochrome c biogenesis protein CcsA [Christiangramia gaetbulicola]PTX42906.1 cytochrome c-type biogenesis protein CcsB [Christiangramia gaetbulicola]
MQKKIASILFSTRIMAVLFIIFAVAMAMGTFIESWYSIETARILIYNTWWFEGIMLFLLINFIGNIKRYQLYKKEKWSTLLLHLSFILILIGAFVTRYISYEGIMPIREGETTNVFMTQESYLTFFIDGEIDGNARRRVLQEDVLFGPEVENDYTLNTDYNGQPVSFEVTNFIHGAEEALVPSEDGENYLKIVEAGDGNRHDHYLKQGEVSNIHNVLFTLNSPQDGAINIQITDDGEYLIDSPFDGNYMRMSDQKQGELVKDSTQALMLRSLYNIGNMQFVIPEPVVKGEYDVVPTNPKTKNDMDAVTINVSSGGQSETVTLLGGQGIVADPVQVNLGDLEIFLNYGSIEKELPFAIKLNDFIAEKYPGTADRETPGYASFKSVVEVIRDGEEPMPYEIYMNHVLDEQGYRFFQSSFDPDEKGTILSVNHDFWGTWITYIGYFLLYIGLMWILFDKGSRFGKLKVMLDKVKTKKRSLATFLALISLSLGMNAQNDDHEHSETAKSQLDSIIVANAVKEEHAEKFGRLVIQDAGGRMKPANTYSSELLRKLSKKDSYEGLTSDQVLISITENPMVWYDVPLIFVQKKNDSLHKILGVEEGKKYLALTDFFDKRGAYKLSPYLEGAYQAAVPNKFQKDFIETDKKVNLLYRALDGNILKIFPIPGDENNKWISYKEVDESNLKGMDSVYTKQILPLYMNALRDGRESGDYAKANQYLESIKSYQQKFGSEVMPSEEKLNAEILYNKYDVFRNLFWMYMLAGLVMLVFVIVQIFYDNKTIRGLIKISAISILILFIMHTAGLAARWYISGHAPWSDAYESMIYVAWATMFFGLAFGRKSNLTIASTAFVASMILMIAHWNWMDPAIANLVPVLDSYWLMIHVSVIVGSYGPLTLGMILGVVALLLMILTTEKNKKKMLLNIREITIITELALTVGLVMLTIGNFLGGQWANESWGRYWGWDPKETWALISIFIYAFVIHMRLVPGLRGRWIFNFMSVIAYSSIMMTYFGVNFYLSGLHSYASGDKVITPTFIYYTLAGVAILGALSYWKYNKHYAKKARKEIQENRDTI